MVPILYEVFSIIEVDPAIRMQMSIGTALAVMIPTSLQSFWAHASRGAADMDIVRRLALPVMLGVTWRQCDRKVRAQRYVQVGLDHLLHIARCKDAVRARALAARRGGATQSLAGSLCRRHRRSYPR